MDARWLFLIVPLVLTASILFNRSIEMNKNYDDILKQKLSKEGFIFLAAKCPKIFNVGPLKKK